MINRVGSKLILLMALLFFMGFYALPVLANIQETIEEKQKELEGVEQRREDEKSALQQRLNREAALKEELLAIENRQIDLRRELERLVAEIAVVEDEIAQAEKELAEAEEQLGYQEDLLKMRLRAIQQHGVVTYLEVLFEAESFSDFLTRLHNLSLIASNDLRLIEEIQAIKKMIEEWRDELQEKRDHLVAMRQQVVDREADLVRAAEERVIVLAELEQEIAFNLKAIQDLEREAQELDNMIRRLIAEASQFSGITGSLQYPIEAPTWVSSGYGWRRDPFSGAQAWHGGIDIAPHHGAASYILAAEAGKVIFSGWNGGYGNCVMIDHGGGTVTLYAHMSSLLVQAGDIVARGQRIARAGTTGYSTGVHLHFEVREYEKPAIRSFPSGTADHRYNPSGYF